jgi:hypothetical protein
MPSSSRTVGAASIELNRPSTWDPLPLPGIRQDLLRQGITDLRQVRRVHAFEARPPGVVRPLRLRAGSQVHRRGHCPRDTIAVPARLCGQHVHQLDVLLGPPLGLQPRCRDRPFKPMAAGDGGVRRACADGLSCQRRGRRDSRNDQRTDPHSALPHVRVPRSGIAAPKRLPAHRGAALPVYGPCPAPPQALLRHDPATMEYATTNAFETAAAIQILYAHGWTFPPFWMRIGAERSKRMGLPVAME